MSYQSRPQSHVDANLVRISILVPALLSTAAAVLAFEDRFDLTVIYAYLRLTGWGMLFCFLCSFGASTFYHFLPNPVTRWLLMNRKYFGLGFAVFIVFHFYGLYLKMDYDPPFFFRDLTVPEFVLGVVAIFFTLAMTFTSSAGMQKKIGTGRWATLHTWGGNGILFAFWITYSDHGLEQLPIFLALNALIILRCWRRLQELRERGRREWTSVILTTLIGLTVCAAGVFVYKQAVTRGGPAVQRDRLYHMRTYYPLIPGASLTYQLAIDDGEPHAFRLKINPVEPLHGRPAFRVAAADNTHMTVGLDNYGVRVYQNVNRAKVFVYDPPGIFLPHLYLYEEKTFETRLSLAEGPAASPALREHARYRLAAVDDITVSGHRLTDCLRVEFVRESEDGKGYVRVTEGTVWLAEGIGRVREQRRIQVRDAAGAVIRSRRESLELVDASHIQW